MWHMWGTRGCIQDFGEDNGGKHLRWLPDGIKINLEEVSSGAVNYSHVAQYSNGWRALLNKVINLSVP
jgi:hypothetical protein